MPSSRSPLPDRWEPAVERRNRRAGPPHRYKKAWALAGGDRSITPLHYRLDTAYGSVSALVLGMELNAPKTLLDTVIRLQVLAAGLPWMGGDLEAQLRHLDWEPSRYVQSGGGAAAFAEGVERYLKDGADEDLLASLTRLEGEIEDRRGCVYVVGLLIDFSFDLTTSFGGSPNRPPSGH